MPDLAISIDANNDGLILGRNEETWKKLWVEVGMAIGSDWNVWVENRQRATLQRLGYKDGGVLQFYCCVTWK